MVIKWTWKILELTDGKECIFVGLSCAVSREGCSKNPAPFARTGTWQTNRQMWKIERYTYVLTHLECVKGSKGCVKDLGGQVTIHTTIRYLFHIVYNVIVPRLSYFYLIVPQFSGSRSFPDYSLTGKRSKHPSFQEKGTVFSRFFFWTRAVWQLEHNKSKNVFRGQAYL